MIEHLRAMIIVDVNRRRFICSWFEYLGGSAANFFCMLLLRFRIVSIECWRGVVRSMPMCIACIYVYLRSRRIHIRGIWRDYIGCTYVVYVRT